MIEKYRWVEHLKDTSVSLLQDFPSPCPLDSSGRSLIILSPSSFEPPQQLSTESLGMGSQSLKETEGPFQSVCLRAVPFPYRHISDFPLSSKLGSQTSPWLPRVTICQLASLRFLALCLSRTFLTSRELSHLIPGKVWCLALSQYLLHSFPLFQWASYIKWHLKFCPHNLPPPNSSSRAMHPLTQCVL